MGAKKTCEVLVTLTNPGIPEYEERDPLLRAYGLARCGKLRAGYTDPKDYRISPVYEI